MAKTKGNLSQTTYSTNGILLEAKSFFHIETDDFDSRMLRQIQRYVKDNKFPNYSKSNKGKYSKKDVEKLLYDDEMMKYFGKFGKKNLNYKTNDELIFEEDEEKREIRKSIFEQRKKAGLTDEQANVLEADKFGERNYLQVDELIALNKKGLVLKSDLTEDEKYILDLYNENQEEYDYQEKQIDEIFYQKKLEIMLTALFNKEFTLDENKLRNDISNYLRSGKHANGITDPTIRRSYLRLQNPNEYFHKKKKK